MPTREEDPRGLGELHEDYVWLVNAAIEEGREDIAWQLSDDYLVEAMELMTVEQSDANERDDWPETTWELSLEPTAEPDRSSRPSWWKVLISRFR